jgi:hypothetical protein
VARHVLRAGYPRKKGLTMASQALKRISAAVARAAQRRDAIEMQGIDRLLSP